MFIIKGEDGGRIDETELRDYPEGHLYCVQPKAWMDRARWDVYLVEMLGYVTLYIQLARHITSLKHVT
jgi:hypothetical protein